jgi:cysteine-rich repeat protein
MIRGGEQCDDGDVVDGDGCFSDCFLEPGWTCSGTPSVCAATCGDGLRVGSEACDDGFRQPGDGCDASCRVEAGFVCAGPLGDISRCAYTVTYAGTPVGVPSGGSGSLQVNVSSALATCRLATVETTHAWGPAHTYEGDIRLQVFAPSFGVAMLSNRVGGARDLAGPYTFVAVGAGGEAWPGVGPTDPIPSDTYGADYSSLLASRADGSWTLIAYDLATDDTGSLSAFSVTLTCRTSP